MKYLQKFKKITRSLLGVILVFAIFFPTKFVFAQATTPAVDYYKYFKELFHETVSGETSSVKQIVPSLGQTSGITQLKAEIQLVMDPALEHNISGSSNDYNRYHFELTDCSGLCVTNSSKVRFLTLLTYKYKDTDGTQKQAQKIVTIYSDDTISADDFQKSTKENNDQLKNISFFADSKDFHLLKNWNIFGDTVNSTNKILLTKQNPIVYFNLGTDKPAAYDTDMTVSFWYCAAKVDMTHIHSFKIPDGFATNGSIAATTDTTSNKITDPNTARAFTDVPVLQSDGTYKAENLCGGDTYFKIAEMTQHTKPIYVTSDFNDTPIKPAVQKSNSDSLPSCGLLPWDTSGTFMGCIALVIYHLFFRLAAFFAYLTGNIFDFFLGYSISSTAYISSFVTSAWETVRDIGNIFFICLLIYVGIGSVFGVSGVNKKLVGTIIINAVLINFSLLITRGVIDISNITARVFYAQIHVENKAVVTNTIVAGGNDSDKDFVGDSGYKSVSTIMLQSFDPQVVFDRALTDKAPVDNTEKGNSQAGSSGVNFGAQQSGLSAIRDTSPEDYAGYFALVSLICAFIAFATGMIFWNIGFIFIGRVVGLYISMIFSPFAFMSRDIPFLKMLDKWHFDGWAKDLTSYLISAPITVLYFYIVIKIMQSNLYDTKIHTSAITATSFTATVLWICIPLIIIYGLLDKGKKMILSFAGEAGNFVQGLANKAGGVIGGAALTIGTAGAAAGIAGVGTKAIGGLGKSIGKSKAGQWIAANADNNRFARMGNNMLNKTQTSSFDFRNSSTVMSGIGKMGKYDSKLATSMGAGKEKFDGGAKGMQERKIKNVKEKLDKKIEVDYLDDAGAKSAWEKHQGRKAEKEAIKEFTAAQDTQYQEADVKKKAGETKKKDLEKENKEIKTNLSTGVYTDEEKKAKQKKLDENQATLSGILKEISKQNDIQDKRLEAMTLKVNSKAGTADYSIEEEKKFKEKLKAKLDTQQKDDIKKYGTISNAKDFAAAMRNDYAEDLRAKSLFMKRDGQKNWSKNYATAMDAEAVDKATKAHTKEYGKNKGKESPEATLRNLNEKVKEKVREAYKADAEKNPTGTDLDDAAYEKMDREDKQKYFETHVEDMRAEADLQTAMYKKAEDEFKKSDGTDADKATFKAVSKKKKQAEDEHNKVKGIWDKMEATQKKIDDKNK